MLLRDPSRRTSRNTSLFLVLLIFRFGGFSKFSIPPFLYQGWAYYLTFLDSSYVSKSALFRLTWGIIRTIYKLIGRITLVPCFWVNLLEMALHEYQTSNKLAIIYGSSYPNTLVCRWGVTQDFFSQQETYTTTVLKADFFTTSPAMGINDGHWKNDWIIDKSKCVTNLIKGLARCSQYWRHRYYLFRWSLWLCPHSSV